MNLKDTNESYKFLVNITAELRGMSKDIDSLIGRQVSDLRGYLLYGDQSYLDNLQENNEQINLIIEEAKNLATIEETVNRFDELLLLNEAFKVETDKAVEALHSNRELGIETTNQNVVPISAAMREEASSLSQYLTDILVERQSATDQTAEEALRMVIIVSTVAFVLSIVSGVLVSNVISRPIIKLGELANQVASGNLAVERLRVKSKDEIFDLNESFNQMTDNLREIISSIMSNSEQVAASSEQLNASANESSRATDQITESIQSIASGSESQVITTRNANEIANDISAGMDHIAKNIQVVTDTTYNTTKIKQWLTCH